MSLFWAALAWVSAGAVPGVSWPVCTPADAGLDAAGLAAFSAFVGGRGCVVRHDRMAYLWGDPARRSDVASAAKPVYVHFLFKALEDGRIAGLDDAVAPLEPRLADLNPALGRKDARITWRHLANQTSCYGVAEAPGTAFCYNDWQMALFWDLLFLRVYGARYDTVDRDVLHALLTDPLGCQDEPTFLAFGPDDRPGRLAISPRDFARFGLLYLRGGRWGDRTLLSATHSAQAIGEPLPNAVPRSAGQPADMLPGQRSLGSQRVPDNQTDHLGSYSWLWWLNGVDRAAARQWPAAPTDVFGCFGHGGREVMAAFPGLDLIVSWNEAGIESREGQNEAFRRLCAAVRAD
ncbi:MAG: hypothetical protein HYU66_17430 [Armatimonadetes bacterium]|nr:hypothetical protein [Armatimonadota bacterium]